ncbi:hypothetical protein ACLESD_09015 [Pyxidicoccus sp. 3LFB2]
MLAADPQALTTQGLSDADFVVSASSQVSEDVASLVRGDVSSEAVSAEVDFTEDLAAPAHDDVSSDGRAAQVRATGDEASSVAGAARAEVTAATAAGDALEDVAPEQLLASEPLRGESGAIAAVEDGRPDLAHKEPEVSALTVDDAATARTSVGIPTASEVLAVPVAEVEPRTLDLAGQGNSAAEQRGSGARAVDGEVAELDLSFIEASPHPTPDAGVRASESAHTDDVDVVSTTTRMVVADPVPAAAVEVTTAYGVALSADDLTDEVEEQLDAATPSAESSTPVEVEAAAPSLQLRAEAVIPAPAADAATPPASIAYVGTDQGEAPANSRDTAEGGAASAEAGAASTEAGAASTDAVLAPASVDTAMELDGFDLEDQNTGLSQARETVHSHAATEPAPVVHAESAPPAVARPPVDASAADAIEARGDVAPEPSDLDIAPPADLAVADGAAVPLFAEEPSGLGTRAEAALPAVDDVALALDVVETEPSGLAAPTRQAFVADGASTTLADIESGTLGTNTEPHAGLASAAGGAAAPGLSAETLAPIAVSEGVATALPDVEPDAPGSRAASFASAESEVTVHGDAEAVAPATSIEPHASFTAAESAAAAHDASEPVAMAHAASRFAATAHATSELAATAHVASQLAVTAHAESEVATSAHAETTLAAPAQADVEVAATAHAASRLAATVHAASEPDAALHTDAERAAVVFEPVAAADAAPERSAAAYESSGPAASAPSGSPHADAVLDTAKVASEPAFTPRADTAPTAAHVGSEPEALASPMSASTASETTANIAALEARPAPVQLAPRAPIELDDLPVSSSETMELASTWEFVGWQGREGNGTIGHTPETTWADRAVDLDGPALSVVPAAPPATELPLASAWDFIQQPWQPSANAPSEVVSSLLAAASASTETSSSGPAVTAEQVLAALDGVGTQGTLGKVLLAYCAGRFRRAFLLGESFGLARVGHAWGPGSDSPAVSALKVDLEAPSLLTAAMMGAGPSLINGPGCPQDEAIFSALGEDASRLLVVAVRSRGRPVAFVVADTGSEPVDTSLLDDFTRVIDKASEAYDRLPSHRGS